jgi:quercetin dioxygenase-like cupin family protein
MRKHLAALLALSAVAAIAVSVAWGTGSSGLSATPLARGAGGEFRIKADNFRFKLKAKESTDVALVRAALAPGGFTGWHGHAGPSLVVVSSGQLTMYAPGKKGCEASVHNAGTTFVHPERAHNFVNTYVPPAGQPGDTVFYIVYFVPQGASPAAIDVTPAPAGCPT